MFGQAQVGQAQKKTARLFGAAVVIGAVAAAGLPVAQAAAAPAYEPPTNVILSITPSKKNVRPGQPVTFTVTISHDKGAFLHYLGVQPWGPLWYQQWPGLTNNTCRGLDTRPAGTQTCHFTVVPHLAKGEVLTSTVRVTEQWVPPGHSGIVGHTFGASTTIRGVGGGNR